MSWLEDLDIICECEDIFQLKADGLICPTKNDLTEYGRISQQLFREKRQEMIALRDQVLKSIPSGKLELGESVTLKCPRDFGYDYDFLILTAIWDFHSEYTKNLFYRSCINSLRQSFKHNMKTLVFPIMPYDGHIRTFFQSVVEVLNGLDKLKNSSEFSLEILTFCSHNEVHARELENYVQTSF